MLKMNKRGSRSARANHTQSLKGLRLFANRPRRAQRRTGEDGFAVLLANRVILSSQIAVVNRKFDISEFSQSEVRNRNCSVPCVRKAIFVPLSLDAASMRQLATAPPSVDALTGHKNTRSSPALNCNP